MEEKKILMGRKRTGVYKVNYVDGAGFLRQYEFMGSVGKKVETKYLPENVVMWLAQQTSCLSSGELIMMDEEDIFVKELKEDMPTLDVIQKQTKTREEVEKLLKGTDKALKKELDGIELKEEKQFFLDIAKELAKKGEFDSVKKRDIMAKIFDIEPSIIFDDED